MTNFAEFMERALYDPEHGFYESGQAGRRGGHFITSPEVGPLFGAVVGRMLDRRWTELGHPDPFTVVDAGAGPGTLARTVAKAEPDCTQALRWVNVERSATGQATHTVGDPHGGRFGLGYARWTDHRSDRGQRAAGQHAAASF